MLKQKTNSKVNKQGSHKKLTIPKGPSATVGGGTMVGSAIGSQFSTKKVPKIKGMEEKEMEEDSVDQPILLSTKQVISNQIERLRYSKEELRYKQHGLT